MTGSGLPPEGFRWVESASQAQTAPPGRDSDTGGPSRSRRWWWIGAVLVVVGVLVAGGVGAVLWWRPTSHDPAHDGSDSAQPVIGTPKDLLISFPLNPEPVAAWRMTGADIGLPPGIEVGDLFASIGEKAYFAASDGCKSNDRCMGWLYGLDTTTGARLFPPIPMNGYFGVGSLSCHSNGPHVAVCATDRMDESMPPPTVWVIDLDRGELAFTGPSNFGGDHGPQLEPVGDYLGETRLVATSDNGVYGVGAHAELTWFVPGTGQVEIPNYRTVDDIPPLTIAAQPDPLANPRERVFSVIDGTDLTPTPSPGLTLEEVAVYNGGFAYQYSEGAKTAGMLFYDTAGREVGRQQNQRSYPRRNSAMPVFSSGDTFDVYTATGELVIQIPKAGQTEQFRTIGTKLYVRQSGESRHDESWRPWDLLTGKPGPICKMRLDVPYVGSDGSTIITGDNSTYRYNVAIDTTTCQTVWETPERVDIWKAGTGLIKSTKDTLIGLRPPD